MSRPRRSPSFCSEAIECRSTVPKRGSSEWRATCAPRSTARRRGSDGCMTGSLTRQEQRLLAWEPDADIYKRREESIREEPG